MPPNEPKPATAEARALLHAAGREWKTVELLLLHPDAPVSSVCFHAQQYLEKAMKAVLVSNAVVFRRTHDLEKLADLLEQQGLDLPLPRAQMLMSKSVWLRWVKPSRTATRNGSSGPSKKRKLTYQSTSTTMMLTSSSVASSMTCTCVSVSILHWATLAQPCSKSSGERSTNWPSN